MAKKVWFFRKNRLGLPYPGADNNGVRGDLNLALKFESDRLGAIRCR
jgi:hypothetical protein